MSARVIDSGTRGLWARWGWTLLTLAALVLLGGCATGHPRGRLLSGHHPRSPAPAFLTDASPARPSPHALAEAEGSAGGFLEKRADAFQGVQEASGLGEEARHPAGGALYLEQAHRRRGWLANTAVTQRSFGPRLVLSWLLREVLVGGGRVEYAELLRRTERFRPLWVVRPDGYLVMALDGQPIQRLGQVKLEEGEFKVGRLVVGAFYFSRGGVLYPVDEALQRIDTSPWAEVGLGRDPLNAALDGAQDAMGELALALARSVLHPIQTVEGLTQLPTTVAHLIASSPEYFARYGAMSLQDQIREAARLSTHLMMMYGGAVGTAGKVGHLGELGLEMRVLSLTARGELAERLVVVSGGTVTTTLGAGVGAVSILHMAGMDQGMSSADATGKARSPHRMEPRIEDGNLQEGWQHIEARHITGTHPDGSGALFPPGTSRGQLRQVAKDIVKNGTRISKPGRRIQIFQMKVKINGWRGLVRIVVDADDANRVITMFPVEGG